MRTGMIRRLFLTSLLLVAGFVGGMVITGRMRVATESSAETAPAVDSEQVQTAQPRPAPAPPTAVVTPAGAIDFTKVAAAAVKGVANISSVQVVQQRRNSPFGDDPFFEYFFGDQ